MLLSIMIKAVKKWRNCSNKVTVEVPYVIFPTVEGGLVKKAYDHLLFAVI